MPKESCYNCHIEHAAYDNVFLQFYPLLEEASRVPIPRKATSAAERPRLTNTQTAPTSTLAARLALRGLDPVLLVAGQEEMGKPEIIADHEGYRYQFVSEPNRVKFQAEAERYSIQNDSCPVVPGAPVDPSRFAVHQGRIYGFATDDCIAQFKQRPTDYLKP
jgi:YHS domain-containing protein